jgi:hypothetical protein
MIDDLGIAAVVIGLMVFAIVINRETFRQFSSLPTLREIWPVALMFWMFAGLLVLILFNCVPHP